MVGLWLLRSSSKLSDVNVRRPLQSVMKWPLTPDRNNYDKKVALTMATTSLRDKLKNPLDAFGKRRRHRIHGVQSVRIQRLGLDTTECFYLLHNVLAHGTSGLLFQLLPIDGHEVYVGKGVEGSYLLPQQTKCGFLCSRVTSVVKDVCCDIPQWDEISKSIFCRMRIEFDRSDQKQRVLESLSLQRLQTG